MQIIAMKEWFQKLNPRERLLVSIAGVVAGIAAIMILAIRPIVNTASKGQERVAEQHELLSEIERVAETIGPQAGAGLLTPGVVNQSLVVIVDRTTRQNCLAAYLKRNQPDGSNSIRLRFENAPFDNVIGWLDDLNNRYGLTTMAANIDTVSSKGRVNCNLTLSRSGG